MYKILFSDVYSGLHHLKDISIDVAITSPPYWGQRDYGFIGQIGNENTYNEYIGKLISIYSLLRKKLKKDGVFFLNIGDKYLSKYGNSPLGMIPFKLAYFMVKDGWVLNDIIIWYKPNHMPSSIKNRFTNSYEPIFVLSKNKKNIFVEHKLSNNDYSNVLKINLKPSPYSHVAVYPEKLVMKLLEMVNLKKQNIILDPFAGSGTTLKAVQDLNESLYSKNLSAIMIESNQKYINIIKSRCSISDKNITKYDHINYHNSTIIEENIDIENYPYDNLIESINKTGFLKINNKKEKFYKLLSLYFNDIMKNHLNKDSTCFIGIKEFDIELIYKTSLLNQYGWIIRNMIVVEENNKWFPLFMIVDDNKLVRYRFNYKKLNLSHKNNDEKNWNEIDFTGYKVIDNIRKNKKMGIIIKVLEKRNNGYPKYVIVKWSDSKLSKEFIINSDEEINKNIEILFNNKIPVIKEKREFINLNNTINYRIVDNNILNNFKSQNNNYNGKFKKEKRKNWGQSPGARSSLEQSFFSKRRLYSINQSLLVDYINLKRKEKRLSKKQLTQSFPNNYKHTVGHWLRKDFGGSIPLPEDWFQLSNILNIDNNFTKYVCKTALKLQTVKNGEYKLPDDFIQNNFLNNIQKLL